MPPSSMPSGRNGTLARYGALWLALLAQFGASIWWAAGISSDVKTMREEIESRRGALAIIDGIQRDVDRIEEELTRVDKILEIRGDLRAKLAQIEEHLRTLDDRVVRLERL